MGAWRAIRSPCPRMFHPIQEARFEASIVSSSRRGPVGLRNERYTDISRGCYWRAIEVDGGKIRVAIRLLSLDYWLGLLKAAATRGV